MNRPAGILFFVSTVFLYSLTCGYGPAGDAESKDSSAGISLQAAREEIDRHSAIFCEAIMKGDREVIGSYYTEDAILMSPGSSLVRGREAISERQSSSAASGELLFKTTTVELIGSGDLFCRVGRYDYSLRTSEGETYEDAGKFVELWRCMEDGSWKMQVDIWNSGAP